MPIYVDVVSFTPTDPAKNFFTYKIPKELLKDILIGQLVLIPWGKKTTCGIVIETKKETPIKNPKPLKKILFETPLFWPNYIELLKWMSWYYHAPMLDCLKTMLPELPLNAQRLTTDAKSFNLSALSVKQTLVLVPTISQIERVANRFNNAKSILIYHKQLAEKELWGAWWKAYYGQAEIILGTRSAVFCQCQNLAEIRIINEEETGFKDVQSPYFDTLKVAAFLAKLSRTKLKIETLTPRPETSHNFAKNIVKKKLKVKPKIVVVSPDKQQKTKDLAISQTLRELLIEKIESRQPVLFFLNKVAESGQIYCADCKFSGYSPTIVEVCPNCKGVNFKFFKANLKSLAFKLSRDYPKVGLKLITERKLEILQKGKPAIILATSAIFSQIKPVKFDLIAVISVDTILNLPDFTSSFKTFATLLKLSQLGKNNSTLAIQTYNPNHPAIKFVKNFDFRSYYSEELALRQKLEFPPFAVLAKIVIKNLKNSEKTLAEAKKLKDSLEKKSLLVEISDPVQSWQGKGELNIIVKAKKRPELDSVLNSIPSKWKVIVDPENLL